MTSDSRIPDIKHWESNWGQTSRFGARCRVEIDVDDKNVVTAKLVNQSALSRFFEGVSEFLPEGRVRQFTEQFATKDSRNITEDVVDAEMTGKIENLIPDIIKEAPGIIQDKTNYSWSERSVTEISTALHDRINTLFNEQQTTLSSRSSQQSVLDVSLLSNSVFNPNEEKPSDNPSPVQITELQRENIVTESEDESTLFEDGSDFEPDESQSKLSEENEEDNAPQVLVTDPAKDMEPDSSPRVSFPELHTKNASGIDSEDESILFEEEEETSINLDVPQATDEKQDQVSKGDTSGDEEDKPPFENLDYGNLQEQTSPGKSHLTKSSSSIDLTEDYQELVEQQNVEKSSESMEERMVTPKGSFSKEPSEVEKPPLITYVEINKEASPDALTSKVMKKVRLESNKVKEAVIVYEKDIIALTGRYPSATFVKIRDKLNKVASDFEKKLLVYNVRWLGMKYPTPIADLSLEQLLEFEIESKDEAKRILQELAKDQLGIKRFFDALNAHEVVIAEAEGYLIELQSPQITQRANDDKTKKLIGELELGLQKAIEKEKIAIAAMLAQANGSDTLVPFIDHAQKMRDEFAKDLANRKQSLGNELFLQGIRINKDNPDVLLKVKQVPINNIRALIADYRTEINDIFKEVESDKKLSQGFKDKIKQEIEQNRIALEVFEQPTYPFPEGWYTLGLRVTEKTLTDASGGQLLQYRREALSALESARERIRPYREALTKAKEGQKIFKESLRAAREKLAANKEDRPFALKELQRTVDENGSLAKQDTVIDNPEKLLERAQKLGKASAKLKASLARAVEWEKLTAADRMKKGSKYMISRDPESVKATADLSVKLTLGKIKAYKEILREKIFIDNLPKHVIDKLEVEIDAFMAVKPKAPSDNSPKAIGAYKQEVNLWALTALRNLENRFHLCAFKNAMTTYEELTLKARTWSPDRQSNAKTPPQLTHCLNEQKPVVEKALARVSGANGIAQAVKSINDSIAKIQTTQKLVESLWDEVRDEVKNIITALEAKKKSVEEQTEPMLTANFKNELIKLINIKIKTAKPYLLGLPSKGWTSWAIPFDKMDETTLQIYRADVGKLTTNASEEIETNTLSGKVSAAKMLFERTIETSQQWIASLEEHERFILAADLQSVLNHQQESYKEMISIGIKDTQGLENFCKSVGDSIAAINKVIVKIQQHIAFKPPSRLVQMEIIEKKWAESLDSIPQYAGLRQLLLNDTARVLDACITHTQGKVYMLLPPEKNAWQTATDQLKLLKKEFLPGGFANQLKNFIVSQAVPVGQLNAGKMKQYMEQVEQTRKQYLKG